MLGKYFTWVVKSGFLMCAEASYGRVSRAVAAEEKKHALYRGASILLRVGPSLRFLMRDATRSDPRCQRCGSTATFDYAQNMFSLSICIPPSRQECLSRIYVCVPVYTVVQDTYYLENDQYEMHDEICQAYGKITNSGVVIQQ